MGNKTIFCEKKERNEKIKEDFKNGKKISELSREHKISNQRISQIIRGRVLLKENYRILIYKFYDYKCQKCGKLTINDLDIHHKDLNPGNNKLENLITLCHDCHVKTHLLEKLGEKEKVNFDFTKKINCTICNKELITGYDYLGKSLCHKCYNHNYITKRWAKDKDYRKAQRARIDKWQKENPDKVKEIANKCYHNKTK